MPLLREIDEQALEEKWIFPMITEIWRSIGDLSPNTDFVKLGGVFGSRVKVSNNRPLTISFVGPRNATLVGHIETVGRLYGLSAASNVYETLRGIPLVAPDSDESERRAAEDRLLGIVERLGSQREAKNDKPVEVSLNVLEPLPKESPAKRALSSIKDDIEQLRSVLRQRVAERERMAAYLF